MKNNYFFIIFLLILNISSFSQEMINVDFNSSSWEKSGAITKEYLGRESIAGFAYLKDVFFQNGIIEVDVAVTGERSYPGIVFRVGNTNYERIYLRPHRVGLYPDALQYTPVVNGIAGWQLYNGPGYTSEVQMEKNEWVKIRIEILNQQAQVFIGNKDKITLFIPELKHGISNGLIGLLGPNDGTAYFSNFKYAITDKLDLTKQMIPKKEEGIIKEWEISEVFPLSDVDFELLPKAEDNVINSWTRIQLNHSGLVDIAEHISIVPRIPSAVYAKTSIYSEADQDYFLHFGYSDYISVFLNGKLLFNANSAYQSRDPSFLGIIGYYDELILPLKKGENELVLLVGESFGGWGFACKNAKAEFISSDLSKKWETEKLFAMPETIVLNKATNELYISNFDGNIPSYTSGLQSISRMDIDGNLIEKNWITGIKNPAGMTLLGDKLFVAEAKSLAIIDINTKEVIRHQFDLTGMMNDIESDENGIVYITDSRNNQILQFDGSEISIWLKNEDISKPNGMAISGNSMYVCNNGDHFIKKVDMTTKKIENFAFVGEGTMDGIEIDNNSNMYLSIWEGKLYKISDSGITKLLDTENLGEKCANFEYDIEDRVFYIPDFSNGNISSYLYKP